MIRLPFAVILADIANRTKNAGQKNFIKVKYEGTTVKNCADECRPTA